MEKLAARPRRLPLFALVVGVLVLLAAYDAPPAPAEAPADSLAASDDSLAAERQRYIDQILAEIAGREDDPAGEVFEDVRRMKDMPARRLLAIMDRGYGRSLGVSCTHCHVAESWAEQTREKRITREMSALVRRINDELLAGIDGLGEAGERPPTVNCTTCHRGEVRPALELAP